MSLIKLASYELAQSRSALLGFNQESIATHNAKEEPD